jgi:hypothetical protein
MLKEQRTRVSVLSNLVNFPSMCPKCLEKTNLTTYTLKWEGKHLEGTMTRVTEKAQVNVPICKSCKRTLMNTAMKGNAKAFAIITPICWGLLYILLSFFGAANWGSWGALFLVLLGGIPLAVLWTVLEPSKQVNWPIKLEGLNVFSVENETYAALFAAANRI